MAGGAPPRRGASSYAVRYVGAAGVIVCGVYWWRWWQQSKLKRAAVSSSMAIEELAFAWLAFSGSLRRFMTASGAEPSGGKQLPTEVSRVLELLRHPSVTGFATRVGEGFATGIANSIRSSGRAAAAAGRPAEAFGGAEGAEGAAAGSSIMRLFTKSPKTNINAVLGPQKIENDGWKGIVEVLVMSLSTDKGKELAVSVTKAFSKELMRSWLDRERGGGERADGRSAAQQRRLAKFPGVLRDSSNMQLSDTGGLGDALSLHRKERGGAPARGGGIGVYEGDAASRAMMTLPMLAFELATTECVAPHAAAARARPPPPPRRRD